MAGFGYSAAIQAVAGLAKAMIPNTTNTNTSGNSSSLTSVDQTTTLNASNHSVSSVQNSIDPETLAALKKLANTALDNSTNQTTLNSLFNGVIQNAKDAVMGIFGKQQQSGAYDNSSTVSQNNDIISRAAADATGAILNYKSQQEQIAGQTLGQVAAATSTQTTTSDQETHSEAIVKGTTQQDTKSDQKSTAKSSMSIICTYLNEIGILPYRYYMIAAREFQNYPISARKGYHILATFLLNHLKAHPQSLRSKMITYLFISRTMQICADQGVRGVESTWQGKMSKWVIATAVFFPGLYCWVDFSITKLCAKIGIKLSTCG